MTTQQSPQEAPSREGGTGAADPRRALAVGLELAKNATRARTLEELQFILVNDTRSLLPFDRALLVVHFEGSSELTAANNQPKLEQKSDFIQQVNALAPALKDVQRGLVLFAGNVAAEGIAAETLEKLKAYLDYASSRVVVILPFTVEDRVIAHLIFEFLGDAAPGEVETFTLMNMVPFFSAALAEKWIRSRSGRIDAAFSDTISGRGTAGRHWTRKAKAAVLVAGLCALVVVLALPVTLTVGGRAEVAPEFEYYAYIQMEGMVDKVFTKEGDLVKKDQVIAALEEKEIQYKIREQQRLLQGYRTEMEILRSQSAENPAKLAESELVAIKGRRAQQELELLTWQRQFLDVRAPVDGLVLTRRVETLVGKRFKAGEPFCKVAPRDTLLTEIFVREGDISYVQPSQTGEVYFNVQPNVPYAVKVESIPPMTEPLERMGAVFRVRTVFEHQPPGIRPGMMGTGHINTQPASIWFMFTRRLRVKLNEFLLSF